MAGTRNQVEGIPWYRAAVAVGVGVDVNAMDQIDTASLVDRARCIITDSPADAVYEYNQDSVTPPNGTTVVAPTSGVGRWLLLAVAAATTTSSQLAWFVDSVTGNDANDGLTALTALKTLRELQLRLEGKLITVSPVITLAGTFPAESLRVKAILANGETLRVTAAPTLLYSGTFDGGTPFSAPGTWALVSDPGIGDYNGYLRTRLRLTANDAVSWVLERTSATTARVAQFVDVNYNMYDPGGGDEYVIESLGVEVGGVELDLPTLGGQFSGESVVENLLIGGTSRTLPFSVSSRSFVVFFGCHRVAPGGIYDSRFTDIGCYDQAGRDYNTGRYFFFGGAAAEMFVAAGARVGLEGNFASATGAAGFVVESGGNVQLEAGLHPFLGSNTSNAALAVYSGALYRAVGDVMGVDVVTQTGIEVFPAGAFVYNSVPTLAGAVNDTVIGNTPKAYADIPYADALNGARMVPFF